MFCGLLMGLVASNGFLFLAPAQGSHVLAGQNTGKTMPSGPLRTATKTIKTTWGTVPMLV